MTLTTDIPTPPQHHNAGDDQYHRQLIAESEHWRQQSHDARAILAFACDLADGKPSTIRTANRVGASHPEDPREIFVQDPDDPTIWRRGRFGFDSDVANLLDFIHRAHAHQQQDVTR